MVGGMLLRKVREDLMTLQISNVLSGRNRNPPNIFLIKKPAKKHSEKGKEKAGANNLDGN